MKNVLITLSDGEEMMSTLAERITANDKVKRIRNEDLDAGCPMYYYCVTCGAEMSLPEDHTCPVPDFCRDCVQEGLGVNRK